MLYSVVNKAHCNINSLLNPNVYWQYVYYTEISVELFIVNTFGYVDGLNLAYDTYKLKCRRHLMLH